MIKKTKNSMLKNRVLTALVLAPLTIAAILLLPIGAFALLWGLILLAAAYEWSALSGLAGLPARLGFVLALLGVLGGAQVSSPHWAPGELPMWIYGPAVVWWLAWGLAFRRFPAKLVSLNYPKSSKLLAGVWVLSSAWILLVWLRLNFGAQQVLYLVLLIWVADGAAYFVGKNYGFTKLAPEVSPGKTTEGVYGALAIAAVFALGVAFAGHIEGMMIADFVFLSLLTVAVSVCGDLFESLAKRLAGVKDSGIVLPGHGGVLDRIDSLLAAVSVFYAGSLLIPIFLQIGGTEAPVIVQPELPAGAIEAPLDPDAHPEPPAETP